MSRKLLCISGVSFLLVVPTLNAASAADMATKAPPPVAPACTWCGFYIGAEAGVAWGTVHAADLDYLNPLSSTGVPNAPYSFSTRAAGIGSGEIGYNWQVGQFVYGLEANLGAIGFNATAPEPSSFSAGFGRFITTSHIGGGLYGDVTARAGVTVGSALLYAKDGYAAYDGRANVDNTGAFGGGTDTAPAFSGGWTAGGGVEYMFAPNWSAKIEYLHFGFGTETATLVTPANGNFAFANRLTADTVQIGFNHYH